MTRKSKAPAGSWASPISSAAVVARSTEFRHGLGQMCLDDGNVYWIEGRPTEGGRSVVVRITRDGHVEDVSPPDISVRTKAHEYGGGDFTVARSVLYYVDGNDQRIYRRATEGPAQSTPLTPPGKSRWADLLWDRRRDRLVCVREDHDPTYPEPAASLIAIGGDAEPIVTLASGADFYSSPALSPTGEKIAWLQWNHPNMPWDGCELWLAGLGGDGLPVDPRCIAGGASESIFQPTFAPDGTLYFLSDRTGWSNLYRWTGDTIQSVCRLERDFDTPQWVFGESTFGFRNENQAVCHYAEEGCSKLAIVELATGERRDIALPFTDILHVRVEGDACYFRAGAPNMAQSLVRLDLEDGNHQVFRAPDLPSIDAGFLSSPESISFPTSGGQTAHAFFYPPRNRDFELADIDRPPLIVVGHGGPTAFASTSLDLKIQFWTSRGFAVVDVNYRGSTGFGRAYRSALKGQWGVADVDDCIAAAQYLVDRGAADADRLIIRGGSAGGYTCLCALTFHDVFRAGACSYGISDLEALVRDTHKFESRYTDSLIAPYPEGKDVYRQRSPIHHVDRLSCPLIVFQGMQDKVVPPSQSEELVQAVRSKGIPVAYVTFEDEGHGFRDANNARRALEAELYFYQRVFGLPIDDSIEPVAIDNL